MITQRWESVHRPSEPHFGRALPTWPSINVGQQDSTECLSWALPGKHWSRERSAKGSDADGQGEGDDRERNRRPNPTSSWGTPDALCIVASSRQHVMGGEATHSWLCCQYVFADSRREVPCLRGFGVAPSLEDPGLVWNGIRQLWRLLPAGIERDLGHREGEGAGRRHPGKGQGQEHESSQALGFSTGSFGVVIAAGAGPDRRRPKAL